MVWSVDGGKRRCCSEGAWLWLPLLLLAVALLLVVVLLGALALLMGAVLLLRSPTGVVALSWPLGVVVWAKPPL